MRSRLSILLSVALSLSVFAGAALTSGCEAKQIDRFVAAVSTAAELPAAFGVGGEEARLVADSFGTLATAARAFRAAPAGNTWRSLVTVFNEVRSRDSWQRLSPQLRERIEAVFRVSQRILESIEPAGTLSQEGEDLPAYPNFRNVDPADLKELERLVKPGGE